MTRCHRVSRCISGQRECVREAERIDDPLLEDVVPDAAAKNLDDASCKDVRGVRVREAVLEWMNLTEVTQALDVAFDDVVAATLVDEQVTVDSVAMVQKCANRDAGSCFLVLQCEIGQDRPDGRVQVEQAFVDQLHDQHRGPYLGDGSDLEQGVGGYLDPGVCVDHAGSHRRTGDFLAAGIECENTELSTGDAVTLTQYVQ